MDSGPGTVSSKSVTPTQDLPGRVSFDSKRCVCAPDKGFARAGSLLDKSAGGCRVVFSDTRVEMRLSLLDEPLQ